MIPRMNLVGLGRLARFQPIKLERAVVELQRRLGSPDDDDYKDRQRRRTVLIRALSEQRRPDLERKDLRVLTELASTRSEHQDRALTWLVEQKDRLRWRDLLRVYVLTGNAAAADGLVHRIENTRARSVRAQERIDARLPSWLPRPAGAMGEALADPSQHVSAWVVEKKIPLTEVEERSEIPADSAVGEALYPHLVRTGSEPWWRAQDPDAVRAWVESRDWALLSAVVERQLLSLRARARTTSEIKADPETRRIVRWADRELGHPEEHPGRWRQVAPEARAVMVQAYLANEIEKILRAFGQSAESPRAVFWTGLVDEMTDAHFIRSDVAVCMMVIRDVMFVEFGSTGNACYMYQRPQKSLRVELADSRPEHSRHYKQTSSLKLGLSKVAYINKMNHTVGWEEKFLAAIAGRRFR